MKSVIFASAKLACSIFINCPKHSETQILRLSFVLKVNYQSAQVALGTGPPNLKLARNILPDVHKQEQISSQEV